MKRLRNVSRKDDAGTRARCLHNGRLKKVPRWLARGHHFGRFYRQQVRWGSRAIECAWFR
jgi:hypothetical protein